MSKLYNGMYRGFNIILMNKRGFSFSTFLIWGFYAIVYGMVSGYIYTSGADAILLLQNFGSHLSENQRANTAFSRPPLTSLPVYVPTCLNNTMYPWNRQGIYVEL